MDEFRDIILDALGESLKDWGSHVPAKDMSLGKWREVMGRLESIIRDDFENAEFTFTTGAVRSTYNRSLTDLATLIDHQLRFDETPLDEALVAL